MQANNSIISNNQMNQQMSGGYMSQHHMNHQQQQPGGNVDSFELPEPPIHISDIGPIPPPPMFSSPSPTLIAGRPHGPAVLGLSHHDYDGERSISPRSLVIFHNEAHFFFTDDEELDSDDEFMSYPTPNPHIDTNRVDEIPAKEPKFNAVPLKSALKKKTSNPNTPTQEGTTANKTLIERQGNSAFK